MQPTNIIPVRSPFAKTHPTQVRYVDHPDALTIDNDARYQPWEVQLGVLKSATDPRLHYTMYYVRAADHLPAVQLARNLWYKWERLAEGIKEDEKYPNLPIEIDDVPVEHKLVAISERDYRKAWGVARRHDYAYLGHSENPIGFTFFNHDTTEEVITTAD